MVTSISVVAARYRVQHVRRELAELLALADAETMPQRAFEGIREAHDALTAAGDVLEEAQRACH